MKELQLINTEFCQSKILSLSIIIGGILFVLGLLLISFPVSVSLIILYIFRDYKYVAVKALYVKFSLLAIFYLIFAMDIYSIWLLLIKVIDMVIVIKVIQYHNFNFDKRVVYKLGAINCLISLIPALFITNLVVSSLNSDFIHISLLIPIPIMLIVISLVESGIVILLYVNAFERFRGTMDSLRNKIVLVIG